MTAREIKRHTYRKEEDEKYNTILANRRHEDELVKMKREAEDKYMKLYTCISQRHIIRDAQISD
jgi:hypothetical protein